MRVVLTLAFVSLVSAIGGCAPEGSSAYVSFNIPPDDSCMYSPSSELFIPSGAFDIGDDDTTEYCKRSYRLHLIVNSNLKSNERVSTGRAEPNVLQVTEADVRLMDKNQGTLSFPKSRTDSTPDPSFPNPFRVQTANSLRPSSSTDPSMGVVAVEAIPKAYASKLTGFDGDNILVEVQIYGTTTGDVDIDFRPFIYPVAICRGCMSVCLNALEDVKESELIGDQCDDDGAQDGRFCIDPAPDCGK